MGNGVICFRDNAPVQGEKKPSPPPPPTPAFVLEFAARAGEHPPRVTRFFSKLIDERCWPRERESEIPFGRFDCIESVCVLARSGTIIITRDAHGAVLPLSRDVFDERMIFFDRWWRRDLSIVLRSVTFLRREFSQVLAVHNLLAVPCSILSELQRTCTFPERRKRQKTNLSSRYRKKRIDR